MITVARKQHPRGSPPLPYCLADVQLIPPCDRILLEMTFAELYRWAIAQLRACVIEADMAFKARGINPAQPPLDNSKVGRTCTSFPGSCLGPFQVLGN